VTFDCFRQWTCGWSRRASRCWSAAAGQRSCPASSRREPITTSTSCCSTPTQRSWMSSLAPASRPPRRALYQLRVSLLHISPPIWSRPQVPAGITMYNMHRVLQVAMGWSSSHLYELEVGNRRVGEPEQDSLGAKFFPRRQVTDAHAVHLLEVAPGPGDSFFYEYDSGDSWRHRIVVEEVLAEVPGGEWPLCLAGKRACPPEDCGGVSAYYHLLHCLKNPGDTNCAELNDWAGSYSPNSFDMGWVNQQLGALKLRG